MALSLTSTVTLNDGQTMPLLGLGTFLIPPGIITEETVTFALHTGYRLIDTASAYGNEGDVGKAVVRSGIDRGHIFITTKNWVTEQGYDETLAACERSLSVLGMDYVDLYLIHWPAPGRWQAAWRAMLRLQQEGTCRAIGVSNFSVRHLEELRSFSPVLPAINQIEFSPFWYRQDLLDYCRTVGIALESYSLLTRGQRLHDPRLLELGKRYGKSPAQVLIRWALQHRVVAIPRSTNPEHIRANADVFDFAITPLDMAELDSMNENYSVVSADWRDQFAA